MNFKRHTSNLNYFLPFEGQAGLKLFVFSEINIPQFSLVDAIAGKYTENFLLIYYKDMIDYSPKVQEILRQQVRSSSGIYWLDDFKSVTILGSSYIYLTKNIVKGFSSVAIGGRPPNIQIVNRGVEGVISFDVATMALIIKPPAGKLFELSVHSSASNVRDISISLAANPAKIGTYEFTEQQGPGAVSFQVIRKGKIDLPQPVSPFFADEKNTPVARPISVFYFDKNDFNNNAELFASIKPYKQVSNTSDEFSSYFETVFKADTFTNFSDQQGGKFHIKTGKLISRVAGIEYEPGDFRSKGFFFIPQAKQNLLLFRPTPESRHLLAGFNGTESFSIGKSKQGMELVFSESPNVSINKEKGLIHPHGDSITSLLQIKETLYHLDSERSPLFENKNLQPSYTFIHKGSINGLAEMPLIPTFSFTNNADLIELEEVLKKVRISNIVQLQKKKRLLDVIEPHITPQGFLKTGNTYDMIKNENAIKRSAEKGNFQFSLQDKGSDLDLSLRKEEVFFVLTPGLFKEYKQAVMNAKFSLNRSTNPDELFELALTTAFNNANPGEHGSSIVIFKFNKKKTADLLKDPTLWSNSGPELANMTSLREVISEIEKNELLKIDDPYFKNSILDDPNWNGILILNVPIGDADNLPTIFTGLANSQRLNKSEQNNKLPLETELRFKYAAFPVNKTMIDSGKKSVSIASTSFYGLIDYNTFNSDSDYELISKYFKNDGWRFILSKLKVRFANSSISFFESFAFLQVSKLFEDVVTFDPYPLSHGSDGKTDKKPNLIRLRGSYQKNTANAGEFLFAADLNGSIKFGDDAILEKIEIQKVGFTYSPDTDDFRFDLDAGAVMNDWKIPELISIRRIDLSNIGLKFKFNKLDFPKIDFDLSKLLVLPEIDFDGKGFMSSFPIRFSHFKGYKVTRTGDDSMNINYDFLTLPGFKIPGISIGDVSSLFSFIFDFDLGTLGNLAGLKALKGQLLMGWSIKGGFVLGLKLNGPSTDGLHIDLFGALKLDIQRVDICKLKDKEQYILRLVNARLTVIGVELPSKDTEFNAMIFAQPDKPVAWLLSFVNKEDRKLNLGIGQRVGLTDLQDIRLVDKAIGKAKEIFDPTLDPCKTGKLPIVYNPENNWLVASENIIPDDWKDVFDLKFIFNDPVLYGVFLRIVGLFDIDVLYKKVSENLGVWSLEFALDPSLRTIDMGGGALTLPNLGIDIYTNGDWKLDVGFPRDSSDWSRSGLFQIRPFVGWAGFYVTRLKTVSLSLFAQYLHLLPKDPSDPTSQPGDGVNIIQTGFAFRIGLGAYISKSVFYAGASISVYGILEGAFAFNKGEKGLDKFFPDHFALRGRIGAIAELIGYVDFKIIKASVHIMLRVEFGFLLVIINGGLQPVPVYIEGEVRVRVSVTIACFRIFRKKICIVIHLSFQATVRFPYTIGGDSRKQFAIRAARELAKVANSYTITFGEIPVIYIPAVIKTAEKGNQLVHQFAVNLFGCKYEGDKLVFSKNNVLRNQIIMPIFEAILKTGRFSYQQLREIFLEGPEVEGINKKDVKFIVNSYRPTLFAGFSDINDKKFLKDHFGLDEQEATSFIALMDEGNCKGKMDDKCPYRVIPIPITSKIKVSHKDGTQFESDDKGFNIELKGLFKDAGGNVVDINTSVKREEKYSVEDIAAIERHFDSYMTQFVNRSKAKAFKAEALETLDIREDAILPEYFKLVGLLTLEVYFNFLSGKQENRDKDNFDPEIKMAELFATSGDWSLNDHLDEGVIGQLNYFYNNGLRLMDPDNKPLTKAYYELQNMNAPVHEVNKSAVLANSDISFTKQGSTTSISLREDMLDNGGLKEFTDTAKMLLNIDFKNVQAEFNAIHADAPYNLLNVKLPVANSTINSENAANKIRFFAVSEKIHQQFGNERISLGLQAVDNKNGTTEDLSYIPCVNVEVKIKPHAGANGATKVAELINVRIADLTLMHTVHKSGVQFNKIAVYLKEVNDGISNLIPLIKTGEELNTKLVRANLSPRTHPPVIIEGGLLRSRLRETLYVANLLEKGDFIRLFWEGLTTNNGGYYLVESPKSDLFSKMKIDTANKGLEYTLVFSFESEVQKPFSGLHNCMVVTDSKNLFSRLDTSSHSLTIDVMKVVMVKKLESLIPVKEYHSSIPVHCFGFTIERSEPNAAVGNDNYLPVEFGIKGNPDITPDKILPLMPVRKKDNAGKEILGVFYSHITPLQKVASAQNQERYKNVGQTYTLNFGVRDTYGFRSFPLKDSLLYTHVYFDKLIPLNAWPFIDCSFWFKGYSKDQLTFELKLKAFHKDLVINEDEKTTIRESLNTILAQLSDSRIRVKLNYTVIAPADLKDIFIEYLTHVLNNLDKPLLKESKNILFSIKTTPQLITVLEPVISIARPDNDALYVKVQEDVWEKETIRSVKTKIRLSNPGETTIRISKSKTVKHVDIIQPLNKQITQASGSPYTLGMGLNENGEKTLYLIRKDYLGEIKNTDNAPLSRSRYFGVRPYSNQLWSGKYQPVTPGKSEQSFANIDLDKGLSRILSVIDDLLAANSLIKLSQASTNGNIYAQKLLSCKKILVETELKNKTDNIDIQIPGEQQVSLRQEFRDLLLNKLNNFYRYDGFINLETAVPKNVLTSLQDYRFTIDTGKHENYNVESSKIYFRDGKQGNWFILFDQVQFAPDISLEIEPQITHIEFEIEIMGNEIEKSNWIQLVEPFKMQRKISTIHGDETKKWPTIIRVFPPKPTVLEHRTEQLPVSGNLTWKEPNDFGKWEYILKIKDEYESNDQLDLVIKFKQPSFKRLAGQRNFKGFIAYWSSELVSDDVKEEDFIDDLEYQMGLDNIATAMLVRSVAKQRDMASHHFILEKVADIWRLGTEKPPFKVNLIQVNKELTIKLSGKGFDIFDKVDRITAVLPEIKVKRNRRAKNDVFVYVSETVSPTSWAVPHIRFDQPIKMASGQNIHVVFIKMQAMELPYKSNVRFLLKTGDLDIDRGAKLPAIPVLQMEFAEKAIPAISPIDKIFDGQYQNGYPAISITVYNNEKGETDLPVFTASTIFKDSVVKKKPIKKQRNKKIKKK